MKSSEGLTEMTSPKSKYDNVESRIKFLVDRDKHNRKIEKKLEEQNRKISKLEDRQSQLLLRQSEQKL